MKSYLAIAVAVSAWGTWPLWLRASSASGEAKGFWVLLFIAALGALACLVPRIRGSMPTSRRDWLYLALMGACASVNQLTYFAAFGYTSVARAALSHYLAPVLVALFAPLLLKERFDRRVPIAMLGAVSGLVLLLSEGAGAAGGGGRDALGVGLGLTSAVFYAALLFCAKRIAAPVTAWLLVTVHCAFGALFALPYLCASGVELAVPAPELGLLALAALSAGLLPMALFYRGLARIPAQHAAVLTYLEPVVSAVLAWAVFGEALGWRGIGGGLLVVAAGVLVVLRR